MRRIRSIFIGITHLKFSYTKVADVPGFVEFLASFNQLEVLEFSAANEFDVLSNSDSVSTDWNFTTLRELAVHQSNLPYLKRAISQNPCNITSLTFQVARSGIRVYNMVSIINSKADTLQNLMLYIAAPHSLGIFDAPTKPLKALIKLVISVAEHDMRTDSRLSGSLSAPNLQNFMLGFRGFPDHFPEVVVKFDWNRFITTILPPSSSLDFAFGFIEGRETQIEGSLREVIPQLGSRLRVLPDSSK
ncbi:hypothetical protein C8J56DRAFT_115746 [Mycena floridula]|nr:hypothetical protein C8J56DRAFT_115746 [Mycena floridula]